MLENVGDHVITVLTRGQVTRLLNDLLNYLLVDYSTGKLFKYTLDDAASALVYAQLEHLVLSQRQQEENVFVRHVQNDALDHVIALLAIHHF